MSHALKAAGCLAGFLAVLFAAAGAHLGLGEAEGRMLASVTMMLGFHAPALIAVALWGAWRGGLLLGLGLFLFALAVLLRVFTGLSLGPVAPIGGFAMMGGWLWLGVVAIRR